MLQYIYKITCEESKSQQANSMSSKIRTTQEPVIVNSSSHEETASPQVGPLTKDQKLFQCGFCRAAFENSAELISHVHWHSLIKPFQCGCCQVSFDSSHDLNLHVKCHQLSLPVQASTVNGNADSEDSTLSETKPVPSVWEPKQKKDNVSSKSEAAFSGKLRSATKASLTEQNESPVFSSQKNVDSIKEELHLSSRNSVMLDKELKDDSECEGDVSYFTLLATDDERSVNDFKSEFREQADSITPQKCQSGKASAPGHKNRTYSCEICGASFKVARYVGDHKRVVHKVYTNKTKSGPGTGKKDEALLESEQSEHSIQEKDVSPARTSKQNGPEIGTASDHSGNTSASASGKERVTRSRSRRDSSKSVSGQKKERAFECLTCRKLLKTERNLKNHVTAVHSGERPFPCSLCPSRFKTKGHMSDHVASVHEGKRPFPCPHCSSEFKSKHWLSVHVQKRHLSHSDSVDNKPSKSLVSPRERTVTSGFPGNLKSEGPFKCLVCEKVLSSERTLKTHTIHVHSNERPFPCSVCPSRFKTKAHMSVHVASVHQGYRPFTCSYCPSQFKSKRWLSMHVARRHSSEAPQDRANPILCHICGRSCSSAANMKRHLQTHSKDRPFKCNFCDAAYRLEKLLHIHMRKHTGEKPYTCEFCGESFARHNNFTYHRNRHLDTRPLRCDMCQKGFNSHPALWQHKRRHLGDKRYSCKQCERKFYNLWSLKRHEVTHTDLRPLSCSKCGKTYRSYSSLKFHQKRHHAEVAFTSLLKYD